MRLFLLALFAGMPFALNAASLDEEPYFLSICAIFKDEAPYMKEWIEYYKLLGVEHFRLYNNDSSDHYKKVLAPYIRKGEVVLVDWPSDPSKLGSNDEWVWATQLPACMDAITHLSGKSKWLAIIDLDEYIVPLIHKDLISFLRDYESFSAVLLNWHNFGTSKVKEIPKGRLLIEMLTHRAEENSPYHQPVKSIVRPDRVAGANWCPHVWAFSSPSDMQVLPSGQEWSLGKIDVSIARINHYVHKTENYLYNYKIPNKERMMGRSLSVADFQAKDALFNAVKDREILRYVPELRKRMFPKKTHNKPS